MGMATSSGHPNRRSGMTEVAWRRKRRFFSTGCAMSVSIHPGATQFTRTSDRMVRRSGEQEKPLPSFPHHKIRIIFIE